MNKLAVIVTANLLGSAFTKGTVGKDGKQYGFIRVESVKHISNGGFLKPVKISALIPMSEADYNAAPIAVGTNLSGRIRIEESLTQTPGSKPKMAGKTGVGCTVNGKQIYRATKWYSDVELAATPSLQNDVLLSHDNTDSIKAAVAKITANAAVNG